MGSPLNHDAASDQPIALRLSVRFHDGLYHGQEWPPSPARLFQALVAGAGLRGPIKPEAQVTLEWFEALEPPIIYAPTEHRRKDHHLTLYVPQNDGDKVAAGSAPASKLKLEKQIQPWFFNSSSAIHYVWRIDSRYLDEARRLCSLSKDLYRLGHGIDGAYCLGAVSDYHVAVADSIQETTAYYPTRLGRGGIRLECPTKGSFQALQERFHAQRGQINAIKRGRTTLISRQQIGPPRFNPVRYGAPVRVKVYSLRNGEGRFSPVRPNQVLQLVEAVREAAEQKLQRSLSNEISIFPLPSIGHKYADGLVRRIMVQIEGNAPISEGDIDWCFSCLSLSLESCEAVVLHPEQSDNMVRHYYTNKNGSLRWFTVTPMVLSQRRRIEPMRKQEQAKDAQERNTEMRSAVECILFALVEANIGTPVASLRVQPEPFHHPGLMAQAFASKGGYPKEALWHVEIEFQEPLKGFLMLGRGTENGLGLFAPTGSPTGGGGDGI